jgi:hypothetical protein
MLKTILTLTLLTVLMPGFCQITRMESFEKSGKKELRGERENPTLFKRTFSVRKDKAVSLDLNYEFLNKIWDSEPNQINIEIPLPEGGSEKMTLIRAHVLSDDFAVTTSDGRKLSGKEYEGLHYQRTAEGNKRIGAFTFREGGVFGVFSTDKGNYNLGLFIIRLLI